MKTKIIFLLVISLSAHFALASPIQEAIDEYKKQSLATKEISDTAKKEFYLNWLEKFLQLSQDNPDDKYYIGALVKAQSLANGIGDYDLSEKLALEICDSRTNLDWKSNWQGELGEIARAKYLTSKKTEDAQKAIDYFQKSFDYIKTTPGKEMSSKLVINHVMMADLHSQALGEHNAAIDIYNQAQQIYNKSEKDNQKYLDKMNLGLETLACKEMKEAIYLGDMNRAFGQIALIETLTDKKWPTSFYINQLAITKAPNGGNEYISIVQDWLNKKPADSWTPFLMFELNKQFYQKKDYLAVITLSEELLNKYPNVFKEHDKEFIEVGKGGYTSIIMRFLAEAYLSLEDYGKAISLLLEIQENFPNDSSIDYVNKYIEYCEEKLQEDLKVLDDTNSGRSSVLPIKPASQDIVNRNTIKNDNAKENLIQELPVSKETTIKNAEKMSFPKLNQKAILLLLVLAGAIGIVVYKYRDSFKNNR